VLRRRTPQLGGLLGIDLIAIVEENEGLERLFELTRRDALGSAVDAINA
jgi:hypothetical protein